MALNDLIQAICLRAAQMPSSQRISKIRELVQQSKEDAKFVRDHFPELYLEAFPIVSPSGDVSRESVRRSGLVVKRS